MVGTTIMVSIVVILIFLNFVTKNLFVTKSVQNRWKIFLLQNLWRKTISSQNFNLLVPPQWALWSGHSAHHDRCVHHDLAVISTTAWSWCPPQLGRGGHHGLVVVDTMAWSWCPPWLGRGVHHNLAVIFTTAWPWPRWAPRLDCGEHCGGVKRLEFYDKSFFSWWTLLWPRRWHNKNHD